MVAFAAFVILFTPRGEALREVFSNNPVVVTAGVGATLLIYVLMLGFYFLRARGMTNAKVNSISGKFKLTGGLILALDGNTYQGIQIGKRKFYITATQASMFTPNANYTVYFTGGGQMAQILSAEQA